MTPEMLAMLIMLGEYLGVFFRARPRCGRKAAETRYCAKTLVSKVSRPGGGGLEC